MSCTTVNCWTHCPAATARHMPLRPTACCTCPSGPFIPATTNRSMATICASSSPAIFPAVSNDRLRSANLARRTAAASESLPQTSIQGAREFSLWGNRRRAGFSITRLNRLGRRYRWRRSAIVPGKTAPGGRPALPVGANAHNAVRCRPAPGPAGEFRYPPVPAWRD